MFNLFEDKFVIEENTAFQLNPQSLAFLGDAVFSLYVRLKICSHSTAKSGVLHKKTTEQVKATHQSELLIKLLPILTDKEQQLVKRARNTKVNNMAKHASAEQYKLSTAFEALLGYLYISGNFDRLKYLLEQCI